ncbi:hypothetical protein ABF179_002225 [Flavobacterium psychrophilum]
MTKGEIDRLGIQIRAEYDTLEEKTLSELQKYRTSHKETLAEVFNVLCKLNRKMGKFNIVTYRIKRFESIIGKLYRYPTMKFSRMWDIGGCRCIVNTNDEVYKLKKLIEQSPELEIRKEYDYIANPKEEGYRSLHLFVGIKDNPLVIELQIRNKIDHSWATLVEITDLLFDAKLKEYKKDKDLLRFHYLLSKINELTLIEKKEIAKIITKFNYLDKLSEVFTKNYIQVRKQWLEIENLHNHNYFLIETTKNEVPKITSYKSFDEAEENYLNIYKNKKNANVVLTHLPKPNYQQISIAYSNYILTFHTFIEDCYEIYENLIEKTLLTNKYVEFYRYFTTYNVIVYNHIKNLVSEVNEINKIYSKTTKNKKNIKQKNKEKEWLNDIQNYIRKRSEKQRKIQNLFRTHIPSSFFGRFFIRQITKSVAKKYDAKLRKILGSS